jgi:hypothetical protein
VSEKFVFFFMRSAGCRDRIVEGYTPGATSKGAADPFRFLREGEQGIRVAGSSVLVTTKPA